MTKGMQKRKYIILIFIILILIFIVILYINRPINKLFYLEADICNFISSMDSSNDMLAITDNGKIYCYNYDNSNVKVILEESDIVFYKRNGHSLIIHKDGSIYIDKEGGFEGKLIGKIEGAVSGDITLIHAAIVTNTGELYMYGNNMYGGNEYNILGTLDRNNISKFEKITTTDNVLKVVCCPSQTYLLTDTGNIYMAGNLFKLKHKEFKKLDCSEYITDICRNDQILFVLNNIGDVYEIGNSFEYFNGGLFYKQSNLKDIVAISANTKNAAAVDRNGRLYFWGKNVDKYYDIGKMEPKLIKGIKNALDVYCTEDYAYIIKNDNILAVPIYRQNKVIKLIEKYNIFVPHFK